LKKTNLALYSAAAGLALLAASGGTTYASWIDRAPLGTRGDAIQTGDLRLDFTHPEVSKFKQVEWRLYGVDGTFPIKEGTFEEIGLVEVGPGYRLEGTTQVSTTLIGETIVAHLSSTPVFGAPEGSSQQLIDWLNIAQANTEVIVTRNNSDRIESNTALTASETFTVTIKVPFSAANFPVNETTEVWKAIMHLGDINLELLQQTHPNAFGR